MNTMKTTALSHTVILAVVLAASDSIHAEDAGLVFHDAVAVWHMANTSDSAGRDSHLEPGGQVQLGVELRGADRNASLARGGDGCVALCDQGSLNAGQGADGELNLSGEAMTMLIRLRDPAGRWNTSLFSKFGGHDRLVYNLFAVDLGSGMDLGFELGIDGRKGMVQVKASLATVGPDLWHDVIARYDGRRLQLFIDGVQVDHRPVAGRLRQANAEPVIVGGHSSGGKPQRPFRGQIDHAALWSRALSDAEIVALSGGQNAVDRRRKEMESAQRVGIPEPVAAFRKVVRSKDLQTYSQAALKLRRWMIENDPHRPTYHFAGPESWINDPNGPIYYRDKYHLFYQFDPIVDGRRSKRCWGHAVSDDLVHWTDWPVAVWPDTKYDVNGVYSGNTIVDDNGDLCALYTGNVAGHRETYGMLVRSSDGGLTFEKKMVMPDSNRPNEHSPVHWDGQAWKNNSTWYQLIGGTTGGQQRQGAAWLWTSTDLERWTLQKNIAPSIRKGGYWELPYLIELNGKHVLFVGSGNPYWLGTFDYQTMLFTPHSPTPQSVDNGHYYSFNVNMTDNRGPNGGRRQLMHGWVRMKRPPQVPNVPYWEQAHSIPRVLHLPEGQRLWQKPIPEIEQLRGKHLRVRSPGQADLHAVRGDALEIRVDVRLAAGGRLVLGVRASDSGDSYTPVILDAEKSIFGIGDRSQTIELQPDCLTTLRVFVDRSIIEAYVNGYAMTFVGYPDPGDQGLRIVDESASVDIQSIDIWKMKSIWGR